MIKEPYKNPSEVMSSAYTLLYEIETRLKNYVNWTLMKNYGLKWQYKFNEARPVESKSLYEIISYFEKYPPLTECFTPIELESLSKLTKVRNKIAHMHDITDLEFEILRHCSFIIKCKLKL
ncbi:hypothetical protein [Salipaludibacillus sp. CF4.18]|uniref:hypothetical protein n=1 Tax=Salipaludibacillus sp. CF4.18 TaxID=3373081 RepID=UPI003EE525A8